MSSIIEMEILSPDGKVLGRTRYNVEYGDEYQRVVVVLDEVEVEPPSQSVEIFRGVNEMLVEGSIIGLLPSEDYDA